VSLAVRSELFRSSYRDSVELMRIAEEVKRLDGVSQAGLVMGTPANCAVLDEAGLFEGPAREAGPNDLVVAVAAADESVAMAALAVAGRLLTAQAGAQASTVERFVPTTIAEAVADAPDIDLVMISTPGDYATAEALKALKRGYHVFLFSDNVPLEDEIALKRLARRKGLLLMGPDCGTAIIDGIPLRIEDERPVGRYEVNEDEFGPRLSGQLLQRVQHEAHPFPMGFGRTIQIPNQKCGQDRQGVNRGPGRGRTQQGGLECAHPCQPASLRRPVIVCILPLAPVVAGLDRHR